MTAADVISHLEALSDRGLLRRLDVALARLLCELQQSPGDADVARDVPPELPLAAALLARAEGQGHSCWVPGDLAQDDAPGAAALQAALAPLLRAVQPLADWPAVLRQCAVVEDVTQPAGGEASSAPSSAPLVLAPARTGAALYLRRYWQHERLLIAQVAQRTGASLTAPDPARVRHWLDRFFGPLQAQTVDWQRLACAAVLRGSLTLVTGGPGTGKTYTAARALALLMAMQDEAGADQPPLRIALAAPTGKAAARLAQAIAQAWQGMNSALAHEAGMTERLQAWAGRIGPPRTLHALLGARPDTRHFAFDARRPLPVDVLLVDEASMVHLELMTALLQALPPTARLVLLGDKDQLASVEAGAVLGDLCRGAEAGGYSPDTAAALQAMTGQALPAAFVTEGVAQAVSQQTVMLRESRRFGGPIGRLAAAVNAGDGPAARRCLHGGEAGVFVLQPEGQLSLDALAEPGPDLPQRVVDAVLDGVPPAPGQPPVGALRAVYQLIRRGPEAPGDEAHAHWVKAVLAGFDGCRVLAALRAGPWGVEGLNQALQAALVKAGLVKPGQGASASGAGWYVGRPVLVTRNDPAAGVFNGDVGLALPRAGGSASDPLRVWFADGPHLRSVLASRLAHVETAFAMTVHKSQGSEFAHTVLVLPPAPSPVLSRELLYTGITRARQALTVVLPGDGVFDVALARRTHRASGLDEGLRAICGPE